MDTGLCTYKDLEKALNQSKNQKKNKEAQAQARFFLKLFNYIIIETLKIAKILS